MSPGAWAAYQRKWRAANPERNRAIQRKSEARPERAVKQRAARLVRRFGITADEYDVLLAAQGGVCALCGKKPRSRRLAVDHDHTLDRLGIKQVYGLLCTRCNRGLGVFEWDVEVLRRLQAYVARIIRAREEN